MNPTNPLLAYLREHESSLASETVTDGQLVEGFVERREEWAFFALMRRHGPMVWRVCRRILQNQQDAEDAFQATFLILVQKAGGVAPRGLVGNWLYGVAVRAAQKAKSDRARRLAKEKRAAQMKAEETTEVLPDGELSQLLDRELRCLPDKYRAPIVLCDLEGRTREEAARELGWPAGSVAGRLARARRLLARRLSRLGLAGAGEVLATAFAGQASASALPPQLLSSTRQFAARLLSGQLPSAALSPRVFSIMKGVLSTMVLAKLKGKLAIVLVILCAGLGLSGFAATFAGSEPQPPLAGVKAVQRTEVPKRDKQEVKKMTKIEKLQGTWNFATLEVDGAKMPQEAFAGSTIEVAGDRFTTTSGQTIYKGTFKVDAGKTPKTIDLHFTEGPEKGNTTLGIYELDGDNWRICLDMGGKARPSEFATKPGSGQALETLKRRKGDGPDKTKKEQIQKEMTLLEGEWSMASGERDGQAFPKEVVESMKRVASDGETTVTMAGQRFMRAKYTVDPSQTPKTIDYLLTDGPDLGKTQRGIYQLDGDTVRFCFVPAGADRPTDFTTKEGSGRTLTAWKRIKK